MDRQTTPITAKRAAHPSLLRRILISIESFLRVETAGGITLLVATAIALLWANLSARTYELSWSTAFRMRFRTIGPILKMRCFKAPT